VRGETSQNSLLSCRTGHTHRHTTVIFGKGDITDQGAKETAEGGDPSKNSKSLGKKANRDTHVSGWKLFKTFLREEGKTKEVSVKQKKQARTRKEGRVALGVF